MLDNLYENIGGKIKSWAKWIFVVEAIAAIITGIILLFIGDEAALFGVLVLICGPIVAYIGSWILYAFGELVEDVHAIRNKKETTTETKTRCEAVVNSIQEAEEKARQESEEKAKAWVTNFLRLQNFYNFKIVSVEEVPND